MSEKEHDRLQDGILKQKSAMPFLDHLEELRWRLIKSVLSVIVCAIIAYSFANYLIEFIQIPFSKITTDNASAIKLYNTEITGTFYAYIKVSLIAGALVALPFIFYQLWSFIAPGLYKKERMMILPLVFISTFLFLVGAAFCFEVVLPISLEFLIGFSGGSIENIITIGSYLSFTGLLLMAFGLGFQMPLLSFFLGKIGIINAGMLSKGRRYAIVGMLVIGAIITPPDVFTQLLLAIPFYLLYEISIIVVRLTQKKK